MNYILTTQTESELYHHGIKGMRWGNRKDRTGSSDSKGKSLKPGIDPSHKKAHSKKKLKYMSDAELREINNRLNMETQYRNMTKTKSKGKKVVDAFCSTATTIAAVTAAYGTYKKVLGPIMEKMIKQAP